MMQKTDEDILRDWDKNPQQSFQTVYDRYSGVLLRFVYRFTGNQEQAEEILQDVFTEAFNIISRHRENLQLKSWLFTVAKNKSLNFEKKKKREVVSEELIEAAANSEQMEDQICDKELAEKLERSEEHLPSDLAHTWDLRKQGLDYQQIADHLNIPLGTVKSRFSRLVDYFRKEFKVEQHR